MKLKNSSLRAYPWLKDAPELDPNSFMFSEHEMDNSFLCKYNDNTGVLDLPEGWVCLGYADGMAIPVRQRENMLAVRFADHTGFEFWCHLCI